MQFLPRPKIDDQKQKMIDKLIFNPSLKIKESQELEWMVGEAVKTVETMKKDAKQMGLGEGYLVNQVFALILDIFRVKSDYTPEKKYAYKRILEERMYKQWSPEDKKKFDRKCEITYEWNDLFFSYTSRTCRKGYRGVSINMIYSTFLSKYRRLTDIQLREERSHIAETIFDGVKLNGGFKCFFDRDNIRNGDEFKKKIIKTCKKSLFFVQFIEPEVFKVRKEKKINWPLSEFQIFKRAIEENKDLVPIGNRYYFILTRKELKDVCKHGNLPKKHEKTDKFEEWYRVIKRSMNMDIYAAADAIVTEVDANHLGPFVMAAWGRITDKLNEISAEIAARREEIIEGLKIN